MNHSFRIPVVWVLLVGVLTLVGTEGPRPVWADNHLIDINEFYSNADGTLQFVELIALANFQTNLGPTHIGCANSDSSVAQQVLDFLTTYPLLDIGETILVATAAFQGAAGFAPDFVMPDGRIFLTSGRLKFDHDAPNIFLDIDAVAYGNYTGPNTGYGLPAAALPSDGFHSLTRTGPGNNNADDFDSLPNSPRRNDGTEGQILPTAVELPSLSPGVLDLAVAPNPIAGGTRLHFDLARGGRVRIAVYGAEGRQVRELWQGPMEAGPGVVDWDRRDAAGRSVPAGVYYLRLSAGAATSVAKVTVLP
jgi:hypothetical protein